MKVLSTSNVSSSYFILFQKKIKLFLFFTVLFIPFLFGQSCPNLITNGDFSGGLTGATTALAQSCNAINCMTGAYCIGNNLQNKCNLWPVTIANSTPSGGNFLMVDGFTVGTAPFSVWRQTAAIPVIFGKIYVFSFWAASVNNPLPVTQQFSLNLVVAPTNVGFLPFPTSFPITSTGWTKYTQIYTPAPGVTSIHVSVEQPSVGAYRDFALDDINFSCSCEASFSATAVGNCGNFQVNNTSCGVQPVTYQWCGGQSTPNINVNLPCGNSTLCLSITDANGCKSNVTQTLNFAETVPPVFTNCPQNTTVNTTQGQCGYMISTPWTIAAMDNCDPNPVINLVYTAPLGTTAMTVPTVLPKGINTFVYQAKDKCGNVSKQCAFTITVVDKEKPIITCPQNVTVQGVLTPPPAVCKATVTKIAPSSVSDNCSMLSVTYTISGATTASGSNDASGSVFMQGVSTVTYTVMDMSGNIATCSFTVIVACVPCACGKFTNMYARLTQGAPNKLIVCGDTLITDCKATFNPIIGGVFQCSGNNCPDSALVNWVLNAPGFPNLGNGNLYAKPNFSLTLLGANFSTVGVYELVLTGVCNGMKCMPCKIYFKVPPINFNTNLTALFPFNGNANDFSPTLIHGVASNVTLNGTNTAYVFNGTTSLINGTNNVRGVTDQVSVCAWIKTTEQSKGMWIAGQYNTSASPKGYLLSVGSVTNGNIGYATFSGRVSASAYYSAISTAGTTKVNDGNWHCIVGTAGNGAWKVYVDGLLTGNTSGLTTPNIAISGNADFTVGQLTTGANPIPYNGEINEVRVYNRVLNDCEIIALCAAPFFTANDDALLGGLRIFPNPNLGSFTVELPTDATLNVTLRVTDLAGRVIMNKQAENGTQLQQVDTTILPNGLYFLQVIANGKTIAVEKFVKQ